jgi:lysophospholipase L1-like esterase
MSMPNAVGCSPETPEGGGTGGNPGTGGTAAGRPGTGGTPTGGKATGGVAATGGNASFSICSGAPPAGTRVVSIYVIGDSTASIYASNLYPRTGWGQVLGDYFSTSCATVKDKALSGRSSKSFYDEGNWIPIRDALVAGDFVIIQFGHNDEKTDDPARYTDPQTTYKQYLTTYVNDTLAKQGRPILATPINRNNWNGNTLADTHGGYPPAMRELAVSLGVPLVDLTALTKTFFERIGPTETTELFTKLVAGESPNYPNGNTDNTHLKETGARDVAQLFTSDAYRQKLPVAADLNAVPVAP